MFKKYRFYIVPVVSFLCLLVVAVPGLVYSFLPNLWDLKPSRFWLDLQVWPLIFIYLAWPITVLTHFIFSILRWFQKDYFLLKSHLVALGLLFLSFLTFVLIGLLGFLPSV